MNDNVMVRTMRKRGRKREEEEEAGKEKTKRRGEALLKEVHLQPPNGAGISQNGLQE